MSEQLSQTFLVLVKATTTLPVRYVSFWYSTGTVFVGDDAGSRFAKSGKVTWTKYLFTAMLSFDSGLCDAILQYSSEPQTNEGRPRPRARFDRQTPTRSRFLRSGCRSSSCAHVQTHHLVSAGIQHEHFAVGRHCDTARHNLWRECDCA